MRTQGPLTPRQHVILRSVARGKTNKDIAAELGISEQGVKVHISRLLERYGAENRVELVSLARAWPEPDQSSYAELSGDLAGIRAGLNQTYQDATAFGQGRGGDGHAVPLPAPPPSQGNEPPTSPGVNLVAEVRSLREVLGEINIALKLARELPPSANVGPLVDVIHTRVNVALEQTSRLDAFIERQLGPGAGATGSVR